MIAADIARSLTKAQRREVLRGTIGDAPLSLVRRLIGMRLMHIVPHSPNGQYGPCTLTPLGLEVRAIIMKEQNDAG
jgi:hypothetical protein